MANEIEIPLTQMFIECTQEWDESEEDKTGWIGAGWDYFSNENFDFEKYYDFYVVVDTDKHYHPIKSIWKLKSEYHNDLLKVPENKIFFNVLSEQEKNRLKYLKTITKAQPNLTADIFLPFEEEKSIELKENYTKTKFDIFCKQQKIVNNILEASKYIAQHGTNFDKYFIVTPDQLKDKEFVKKLEIYFDVKIPLKE